MDKLSNLANTADIFKIKDLSVESCNICNRLQEKGKEILTTHGILCVHFSVGEMEYACNVGVSVLDAFDCQILDHSSNIRD